MSACSFLGVILSDERSAESKDPYGRQPSQTCCCATRPHLVFSQLWGSFDPAPARPAKEAGRKFFAGAPLRMTPHIMNNPGSAPRPLRISLVRWGDLGRQPEGWLYPVYINSETCLAPVPWNYPTGFTGSIAGHIIAEPVFSNRRMSLKVA